MFSTAFRRWLLLRLAMLADLCIFTASVLTAFWVSSFGSPARIIEFSRILHLQIKVIHFILFFITLIVWHLLFRLHRLYQSRRLDSGPEELIDILKAVSWGTAACIVLGRLFMISTVFTPVFIAAFWFSNAALSLLFRIGLRVTLITIRRNGKNLRFILMVGTNRKAYGFARMVEDKKGLGYRIVGYVDDTIYQQSEGISLLGTLKDFHSIIRDHVIDEVIITLPVKSHYEDIQNIIRLSEEQGIKIKYLADIFETTSARLRPSEVEQYSMMTATRGNQKDWYFLVKRIMDVLLTSFVIITASPILVLTALTIKLTSPGPVLFIQTRVGLNKRRFRLYKFRTMVADAEKRQSEVERLNEMDGPVFKISNDPRVTKIGRWLRKTSIDELPQLFNVLRGDMSLVGPRPLPERDYNGFDKDWQRKRFSVLPGITCIWQVSGRNGVAFEDWMKMDMEYIEKWTPMYDFKILLKTIPAVFNRNGAV